jgi:hypothetical protein
VHHRISGKTSTLTNRSRFFAPALAANSDTMAVVETTKSYEFFITLVDIKTGETLEKIPTPDNAFPMHPSWSNKSGELVMILLQNNKKSIVLLNISDKQWNTLRAPALDEP